MTSLIPATLTRLKKKAIDKASLTYEPDGEPFNVQFNPTTLKIARSNNIDKGGATTNTQIRQAFAVQSATLTFDLEFDTAEEADELGNPKDVRSLTLLVRQFTEPTKEDPKTPPPAVRFQWGSFTFQGIVTQLTEDLDYFAPSGTPLRAKLSVTVTEVNPEWDAGKVGNGARDGRTAIRLIGSASITASGGASVPSAVPGTGPGSSPSPNPRATVLAHAGESVQQLLARLDADPATWRSAMTGLDSPLALAAGKQVQLGPPTSAFAGIGAGGGFTASAGIDDVGATRAALGLAGGSALGRGATAEATAGFVLAEAGGVAQASARVEAAAATSAQASARSAFAVPAATVQPRAAVQADGRTLTYGRGIPLRSHRPGDASATLGR